MMPNLSDVMVITEDTSMKGYFIPKTGVYYEATMNTDPDNVIEIPKRPYKEGFEYTWDGNAWQESAILPDLDKLATLNRRRRSLLLSSCDWTQLTDCALSDEEKQEWAEYRQKLRDVPEQKDFPLIVDWPVAPE